MLQTCYLFWLLLTCNFQDPLPNLNGNWILMVQKRSVIDIFTVENAESLLL